MTKIFRKLENQKYDSMNSHTLILTGWVGDTQKGRGTFVLTGDGKELFQLEPEYVSRPDVSKNLSRFGEIKAA